jgi:thymidylate synthase (FAD)
MPHVISPAAEEILDKEFKVLDKGFVRLVDYLGGDERIVQAARVSYGAGTKSVREDQALIRYLMRHLHTSPFEQVILTFHVKLPIFVARQWIRHRTARLNEISGRYSVMEDEFYLPEAENVRFQSRDNKQGRATEEVPAHLCAEVLATLKSEQTDLYKNYMDLIDKKIARELARVNLPLSLYTQWYWQVDLHNLFHFLRLRMDTHAQLEIRLYAEAMAKMAQAVAPHAYEAFEEELLHGARFSRQERAALKAMLSGEPNPLEGRTRREFEAKLNLNSK